MLRLEGASVENQSLRAVTFRYKNSLYDKVPAPPLVVEVQGTEVERGAADSVHEGAVQSRLIGNDGDSGLELDVPN